MKQRGFGFTLTELLIVIAIIGILVLIALPNFLNAQTRARVSAAKSDMKAIATGIELYATDNGVFPRGNFYQLSTILRATGQDRGLLLLSTPISYVKRSLQPDAFDSETRDGGFETPEPELDDDAERIWYKYSACNDRGRIIGTVGYPDHDDPWVRSQWYILQSSGPDRTRHTLGQGALRAAKKHFLSTIYDPTNGTVSRGSIYRTGGTPTGVGGSIFKAVQDANR